MTYVGRVRTADEFNQAIRLAVKSFPARGLIQSVDIEEREFFLRGHPGLQVEATTVVVDTTKGVVAAAFLAESTIFRGNQRIPSIFISSVCVDHSERGKGYSVALMHSALSVCAEMNALIAIVIARRAVDHFYNRFGFHGIAQYSRVKVSLQAPSFLAEDDGLLRPVQEGDLDACAELYRHVHQRLFGPCVRDRRMWAYIFKKASFLNVRLEVFEISGRVHGYLVFDTQGNVYEVAFSKASAGAAMLSALSSILNMDDTITIHVSPKHPVVSLFSGLDVSLTTRECAYGGHMACVVDKTALTRLLEERVACLATMRGAPPQGIQLGDIKLEWDGINACASLPRESPPSRLIPDLLSAAQVSSWHDSWSCLYESFDIPLVDQI